MSMPSLSVQTMRVSEVKQVSRVNMSWEGAELTLLLLECIFLSDQDLEQALAWVLLRLDLYATLILFAASERVGHQGLWKGSRECVVSWSIRSLCRTNHCP